MDLLIVDAHLCHCRLRPGSWSPASWRTAPRPTQPRTRTCHATSPLSVTQCAEVLLTATRSPRRRPGPGHTPRGPRSSRRTRPGRTVSRSNLAGTRRCRCYSGRVANTDLRTASNYCRSINKKVHKNPSTTHTCTCPRPSLVGTHKPQPDTCRGHRKGESTR